MAEWKKIIVSGSDAELNSVNIGAAEDGTYTDGLFTDFTTATTIGTAVDRFNEVLKGLSPSAAPILDNVESSTSTGVDSLKLAFGSTLSTSSYGNVTGTGSLSAVDFTGTYSRITGTGGGYLRLGVFDVAQNIALTLNQDVPVDSDAFVNYPADAFNVPVGGGEAYTLEVNGTAYQETTSGTSSLSGTYFTLTQAQTGSFKQTGLPFNVFRHRTGTVLISSGDFQNGWNYAKITNNQGNVTNYIDWVYDPAAAPGNFAFSFNGFTSASIATSGIKWLSGVPYLTSFSYNFSGSIGNYYKNVYNNTTISANSTTHGFNNSTSGLTAATVSITSPTTADSQLPVISAHTVGNIRILGTTLASTLDVQNTLGKSGEVTVTTPTILLDKINTSNTRIAENFCLENYRITSGSYIDQASLSGAINAFPSGSTLDTAELAVYNGQLQYPNNILNSGNVAGASIIYYTGTLPDYSAASGDRWFFRANQNGSNAAASFTLAITGTNTNFTAFGGALTGNNVKIWIKVPGKTGWRDVSTSAPANTTGIATNDNVGCRSGAQPSDLTSSATRTFGINLLTEGMTPSEYFAIRIQASSGWEGTITKVEFTGNVA